MVDPASNLTNDEISGLHGYASDPQTPMSNNTTIFGSASGTTEMPEQCIYYAPPIMFTRFCVVTFFGSIVSVFSIVVNSFTFVMFVSKKCHRKSYNLYLIFIAFFDVFISLAYIFLMSINVLSDYLQSPFLIKFWLSYMIPMLTISHIALTSSSFLILAASIERYAITKNASFLKFIQKKRIWIAMLTVFMGFISKGSIFVEIKINRFEECKDLMTEYQLDFHDFVHKTPYNVAWRFWYRNIVTVFFPFFMLAYFNISIVRSLSKQHKQSCVNMLVNASEYAKRKKQARSATMTMIFIVCCYLASNVVNVLITIWELIDKETLAQNAYFYAISLDLISLLSNLSCAVRVPIYLACQAKMREEFQATLSRWFCGMETDVVSEEHNTEQTSSPGEEGPSETGIVLENGRVKCGSMTYSGLPVSVMPKTNEKTAVVYRSALRDNHGVQSPSNSSSKFDGDSLTSPNDCRIVLEKASPVVRNQLLRRAFFGETVL